MEELFAETVGMPLTRTDTDRYLRGLYRFLAGDHAIRFKKMRVYRGKIEYDDECRGAPSVVMLDPRDKIASTLIHEYLHYRHPDWSETDVLRMESSLVNSLTERQVRNLIKRFADAL